MQIKAFSVLLLTLASAARADRVYEWRNYFKVNIDNAGNTAHEIVFALDTEFYTTGGSGENMEEILKLTASVHVDHVDHSDPFSAPAILDFVEQGTCFEVFEDAYCMTFNFSPTYDQMLFYVSKVDDTELVWPALDMDYVDYSGLVKFDYDGGENLITIQPADGWLQQVDRSMTEFNTDGWTRSQTVHVRFSQGRENVEKARTQVFSGSHWATYQVPQADYEGTFRTIQSLVVDADMDNTFDFTIESNF